MLALTIAKVGLDSVVFAVMTGLPGRRPSVGRMWLRYVLPLSILCGLFTVHSFGWAGALVIASSASIDSWSAAQISWRGAREQFRTVVVANLLNYPLFFGAIFALSAAGWPARQPSLPASWAAAWRGRSISPRRNGMARRRRCA